MRFWSIFLIVVGAGTRYLPQIGEATIGRPIVFYPFHILGDKADYAHWGTAALGLILLIISFFRKKDLYSIAAKHVDEEK